MRVLVVEDDGPLGDAIVRGLRQRALGVDLARDGAEALEKLASVDYDVVVLDRDLPVVHGDEVCRQLNESQSMTRVLMLTASTTVEHRVEGLTLGADDYMPKPFAMQELHARVRALGRRAARPRPARLEWGELVVDPARRRVERAGRPLDLTNREFAVLEELISAPGVLVSAEELMERVWDDRLDPFSNAVRVTIATLRRKLGDPPLIETVARAGYRLSEAT
ncbi:MAG: response regulator transcription factor [Acidimicrobiia bacterium]|nr:response regulator transcription factor [Acidimicrobiia bacterium]